MLTEPQLAAIREMRKRVTDPKVISQLDHILKPR
jgi:hypothetical protein